MLPSSGTLYRADIYSGLVQGITSAGSPLGGNFPIDPEVNPGAPFGTSSDSCGVAVGSNGDIWVANWSQYLILRYSSSGSFLEAISTNVHPCKFDVDSNDDLFVTTPGDGSDSGTWKFAASSGYASPVRIDSALPFDVAVDPLTHHVFIALRKEVAEYDAAGNLVTRIGIGIPGYSSEIPNASFLGVAIDSNNNYVYASDTGNGKVRVFGPPTVLPDLTTPVASAITDTTATLAGSINPLGENLADCHFEYVTETAFESTGFTDLSSGGSVACNPQAASIPADSDVHAVSAGLVGLAKDVSYRARLVGSTGKGTIASDSSAFTTFGPPLVETTGSPTRTATATRLEGRIYPVRTPTAYHFEYGTEGPCGTNPCTSTDVRQAGSGGSFVLVSEQIENLQPNTTYHYRVVAENSYSSSPVLGEDMTVTTRASDAPLSHGRFPGPPDSDRAYEQVSLPDTGGNPVRGADSVSDNGERVFYQVSGGTPISSSGAQFSPLYAERTSSGWRSENIHPPREELTATNWLAPGGKNDLSDQVAFTFNNVTQASAVWRLRPGQPAIKVFEPEHTGEVEPPVLIAADASRALLVQDGQLVDVTEGTSQVVSLMPDGSQPGCGVVGSSTQHYGLPANAARRSKNWVSPDGSLVFFPSRGNDCLTQPQLYMRELDAGQTKLISGPSLSSLSCGAFFLRSDTEAAYFWTQSRLSPADSDPTTCSGSQNGDVYRYGIADGSLECLTCVLADVPADVEADTRSIAVADDGSRVYFDSVSRLLPGAPSSGLYRLDVAAEELAYVGPPASVGDAPNLGAAITSDGSVIVFASANPALNALGGQQNGGSRQYYRYDDRDRSLTCVSCPVSGAAPAASVGDSLLTGTENSDPGANRTALSADGQTFAFATPTPLLGPDQNTSANGQNPEAGTDVYEWREGKLLMVTDGLTNWTTLSGPSVAGLTPSGRDLFFLAAAQYTPDALDGYKRLYDARIGGGFEFPPPPKPCPLEVCQGTPKGAPEEQAPGTGTFSGSGNESASSKSIRCRKSQRKVRRAGKARCVKRPPRAGGRANHKRRTTR